jgi:energy-coupling factor transporter ATP-binding protein EcfA2
VHFLSGGEKKLAAIAGVLVMRPDVVILDEPTAALDMKNAEMVENAVSHLSSLGITVHYVHPRVEKALSWADGAALFENGRVIARDTPFASFRTTPFCKKRNCENGGLVPIRSAAARRDASCGLPPAFGYRSAFILVQMAGGKFGRLNLSATAKKQ